VERIVASFPAFQSANYRLYFFGQLISLIGTWMQIVAQGWLVLTLTNSAFLIGLITALNTLPSTMFTLFGGVIVDRFPKKQILVYTQIFSMILAFLLGILTLAEVIQVWHIATLGFLLGMVNAVDAPARQAFVSDMVSKEQLPSAIALNSGVFNAARVIGPGVAGILISMVGTGGAFIANGFSYIAVILALLKMSVPLKGPSTRLHPIRAIKEGLVYSFTHPIIATLMVLVAVVSIFGWSYTTILPLIARNEFKLGAAGLGYLYAAGGLGSLIAAITVASFSKRISPMVFILGGNFIFSISLTLFTFTKSLPLALFLLFLAGFGLLCMAAMINTTIQNLVRPEFRGRVMSIYIFMFIGLTPVGNLEIGSVSERMGTDFAIRLGAIVVFIFGLIIFYYKNKIRTAYSNYKKTRITNL